jgi:hypothetical protein
MKFKKTITDILNTLPIIKNKKFKSPGVYTNETDTTYSGGLNKSDTFEPSTNPFTGENDRIITEGKIVINKK